MSIQDEDSNQLLRFAPFESSFCMDMTMLPCPNNVSVLFQDFSNRLYVLELQVVMPNVMYRVDQILGHFCLEAVHHSSPPIECLFVSVSLHTPHLA